MMDTYTSTSVSLEATVGLLLQPLIDDRPLDSVLEADVEVFLKSMLLTLLGFLFHSVEGGFNAQAPPVEPDFNRDISALPVLSCATDEDTLIIVGYIPLASPMNLPLQVWTPVHCERAACPTLPSPLPSASALPIVQELPNPFAFFDGTPLTSPDDWECRRAEIKTLVQEYLYSYHPDHSLENVTARRTGNNIAITVKANGKTASFSTTLTFPNNRAPTSPIPVVINPGALDNNVFLSSGIALATFDVNSIAADSTSKTGAFWTLYAPEDIGVLMAWAWGFNRILDALELVAPEVDPKRVGVIGCSRWGKAALVAGMFDDRITLTMPMSSGLEGISQWRFLFQELGPNENITNIFAGAPWWVTSRLGQFVNDTRRMPFDSHLQASLVAPRALIWDQGLTDIQVRVVPVAPTQAIYDFLGVKDQYGAALRNSGHCDPSGYSNIKDFMNRVFFGTPRRETTVTFRRTRHTLRHFRVGLIALRRVVEASPI
ncbi:unnamed protein product [Somion occarium]|uniref:(4-O-methyl)-D-glucuronate--lignin esterase n=1 Tax=Somion occarium TaxID=3059160 RepID=A0ABP1E998_9APHY